MKAKLPKLQAAHARDGAGLFGIGLAGYGFWLIWHPLGFIAVGAAFVALAILTAKAP